MYQPPQPQQFAPQPAASSPSSAPFIRIYSFPLLIGLIVAYVLSMTLLFTDPNMTSSASDSTLGALGSLGMVGLLAVGVTVCILDWRGFTSLNGFIKWGRMRGWQKFIVGYFFLGLSEFLLAVYFVQASLAAWRSRLDAARLRPLETQRKTAQLEASLGILPATEGVCHACGKPLQVGAEYCAYCATPVVAQPKICPVCAATALPDAKWCPKCRAALPA